MGLAEMQKSLEEAIDSIAEIGRLSEECRKAYIDSYHNLSRDDQISYLVFLKDILSEEPMIYIGLLTVLMDNNPSVFLYNYINDFLCSADLSLEYLLVAEYQLRVRLFTNRQLDDGVLKLLQRRINKLFLNRVNAVCEEGSCDTEGKRIVLMAEQLLNARHAPSNIIYNLYSYLQDIGYEPYIIIVNTSKLTPEEILRFWWADDFFRPNSMFENACRFNISCFEDQLKVEGELFQPGTGEFESEMRRCMERVLQLNPLLLIDCGGMNHLADRLCGMMPVAGLGFQAETPLCDASYIISDGRNEAAYKRTQAVRDLEKQEDKQYFPCVFSMKYSNRIESRDVENKMGVEGIKVAIVGNRLDREVNGDFEQLLKESIVDHPGVKYILVGECPELKQKYMSDQEHFCFMGYVNELEQVLKHCDLYLNPPRMGGGISGLLAVENGIPVITLSNGDVALYCGDFAVDNMEEMKRELYCCLSDREYLLKKKEKAAIMSRYAYVSEEQSRENIRKCITSILEAAKGDGRRRQVWD